MYAIVATLTLHSFVRRGASVYFAIAICRRYNDDVEIRSPFAFRLRTDGPTVVFEEVVEG